MRGCIIDLLCIVCVLLSLSANQLVCSSIVVYIYIYISCLNCPDTVPVFFYACDTFGRLAHRLGRRRPYHPIFWGVIIIFYLFFFFLRYRTGLGLTQLIISPIFDHTRRFSITSLLMPVRFLPTDLFPLTFFLLLKTSLPNNRAPAADAICRPLLSLDVTMHITGTDSAGCRSLVSLARQTTLA